MTGSILVDTHIVLWLQIAPRRLTVNERQAVEGARRCCVSIVTIWEIAVLMSLGRVGSNKGLLDAPSGFDLLPVRPQHCKALLDLPQRHRDPFDRMLIAQAQSEKLPLLTRDRAILQYRADGLQIVSFSGRTAES